MLCTPRAIVFDLDGTLIDSRGDIAAACNFALQRSGRAALALEEVLRYVGDGAKTLCARAAGLSEQDPAVDRLVEDFLNYYLEHPVDHTRFMPGARRALDALKHFQLAICTNKPRPTADAVLVALGVRTRFAAMIAGGDLPEKKPAPGPVFAVGRALGLQAEQLVVVGDSQQDVLAGRRAGSRTVGIENGYDSIERLQAARPDVLIETMEDLPEILARWTESTMRVG
jgi:2-phosphoglycolate phosphatase